MRWKRTYSKRTFRVLKPRRGFLNETHIDHSLTVISDPCFRLLCSIRRSGGGNDSERGSDITWPNQGLTQTLTNDLNIIDNQFAQILSKSSPGLYMDLSSIIPFSPELQIAFPTPVLLPYIMVLGSNVTIYFPPSSNGEVYSLSCNWEQSGIDGPFTVSWGTPITWYWIFHDPISGGRA